MTAEDTYSFEPVVTSDPSAPAVDAAPSVPSDIPKLPKSYYDETERPSDTAVMVGCGLLGCLMAGPFVAVLAALGGKYAAGQDQGVVGEATRAVGRIASAAGKRATEERLLGKLKAVASAAGEKAKEERLLERLQAAVRALFSTKDSMRNDGNNRDTSRPLAAWENWSAGEAPRAPAAVW